MDNLYNREMASPIINATVNAELQKLAAELESIKNIDFFTIDFSVLEKELCKRQSSLYTEELMFDVVWLFIIKYQDKALDALDKILNDLPPHTKYYYPYLLGHLVDDSTLPYRLVYLNKYSKSIDEDIREGAIEGLGYLNS
jgi:hypothetical protein